MGITTLDAHVGGAAVRLVTSGFPRIEGASMAERRSSFDLVAGDLALCLTSEPRGHAGMVGVVLTEPDRADADAGMLFFTGAGPRRLSGHAAMAAVALALDNRLLTPRVGDVVRLDSEAGAVAVHVAGRDAGGRVRRLRYEGPPAAVLRGNVRATAVRRGIRADLAWSGSEVVAIVEGEALGVPLSASHTLELRQTALDVIATLDETLLLTPPGTTDPAPVTACALVGPAGDPHADVRSVLVRSDGTVTRTASASGTAAVAVVLAAMGLVAPGAASRHESLSGTSWTAEVGPHAGGPGDPQPVAIVADVYSTGTHEFVIASGDPLPRGVSWV